MCLAARETERVVYAGIRWYYYELYRMERRQFYQTYFSVFFSLSLLRCIIFSVLFLAVWRRGSISKQQHNEHNHTFVFIIVKCPGLYKHHSSQATSFVLILLCLNSIRIRCFISRNYYYLLF